MTNIENPSFSSSIENTCIPYISMFHEKAVTKLHICQTWYHSTPPELLY